MKITPLNGYVVVKPEDPEEKTASGIIIPETSNKEKPQKGKVVAVAKTNISTQGAQLPIEVKEGDIVLYGRYSGDDIKVDGVEYKFVEMSSIRAIIK